MNNIKDQVLIPPKGNGPLFNILKARVHNLVDEILPEVSNDNRLTEALELNDKELMKVFFTYFLESQGGASKRERDKIKKRVASTISFYERLDEYGGVIKAKDVANILSVTRQTVNNRVNGNKLLAIKKGADYLFPIFQFEDLSLLSKYEEIFQLLPNDMDSHVRFSFFANKIEGTDRNPIDIVKSGDAREVAIVKKKAGLLGRHVAK